MTALAFCPDLPSFKVATLNFGGNLFKFNNQEETPSESVRQHVFVSGNIQELEMGLLKVFLECSVKDWDGYGAQPINIETLNEALVFLNMIPRNIPSPEIVPEPAGEIGFEWNFGKDNIFAASVNGTGIVAYAGILGNEELRTRGTAILEESIFSTFEKFLSRIIPTTR